MKIEKVKPYYNKKETIYVFLSIIVIIIFSIIAILFINIDSKENDNINNTISSFSTEENIIYTSLNSFLDELDFAKDEGYLNVEELSKQNISPFFEENNIKWEYKIIDNKNYYIGISNNKNIGNFLVVSYIDKNEVKSKILYYKGDIKGNVNLDIFKEIGSSK